MAAETHPTPEGRQRFGANAPVRLILALGLTIALTIAHILVPRPANNEWEALVLPSLVALSALLIWSIVQASRDTSRAIKESARSRSGAIESLAEALKARDDYTADHSSEVADMAEAVGIGLGMSREDLDNLRLAALLHDVGKVGIPDPILQKPGALNDEEREIMQQHPEIGARILSPLGFMEPIIEIVLSEHERWDGGGYPRGLKGENIPLGARIIFVCDAFHAMTSDRPYRDATDEREAMRRLRESAGSQFDPAVVNAFIKNVLGLSSEAVVSTAPPEGARAAALAAKTAARV